jgi:hypothetical protein
MESELSTGFYFSTDSWLVASLVLMVITTIPVKIVAELFGAHNKQLKHCALAVILGTTATVLLMIFVGGFLGLVLAFGAISAVYWKVLDISLPGSFLFTIVVMITQAAVIQGLLKIGILLSN